MQCARTDSIHKLCFHRDKLNDYLPKHFAKTSRWKRWFKEQETVEYKLADAHQRANVKYGKPDTVEALTNCYRHYLHFLRQFPYYG